EWHLAKSHMLACSVYNDHLSQHKGFHYQDFHLGEEHQPHAEATAIIETLKKAGAKYQGLTMDMGATIQPRFQANIYRKDF
ncbi:peptidoglycan bridge formation glycyltransferase FemA/FemB family protein, partial [Bacillus sp. D-CC]